MDLGKTITNMAVVSSLALGGCGFLDSSQKSLDGKYFVHSYINGYHDRVFFVRYSPEGRADDMESKVEGTWSCRFFPNSVLVSKRTQGTLDYLRFRDIAPPDDNESPKGFTKTNDPVTPKQVFDRCVGTLASFGYTAHRYKFQKE